jgi:hypothetical protein
MLRAETFFRKTFFDSSDASVGKSELERGGTILPFSPETVRQREEETAFGSLLCSGKGSGPKTENI